MSGLAALLAGHNEPAVYQWHSAANVQDVQHAVEKAGWKFVYLDGWTVEDKQSFLKATAAAFDEPDHYGESFETLATCLSGVTAGDCPGIVMLWDGWSPLARHDEQAFSRSLAVLGERVRTDESGKFAVLLRGDGPPLELPELPAKQHA